MKDLTDDIMEPGEPGPVKKTRDELIAELQAADRPKSYTITAFGAEWSFIYPERTSQLDIFKKEARDFALRMGTTGLPAPYKEALAIREMDAADFTNAFAISFWSNPDQDGGKVSEPQALKIVALQPGACQGMVYVIEAAMMNAATIMVSNDVIGAKKNLKAATKKSSGSKQASSSTVNIHVA